MKTNCLRVLIFILFPFAGFSQTIPAFSIPDTVCVNTPVNITNTSIGATSYYWNFCVANSTSNPVGTNLGNFGFNLSVFVDYAKDGNNYYAFVTNNMPGKLVRLDFGNSLLNTPTAYDFGNLGGVIPDFCEGIQIVKNEGHWYAIIVGDKPVGRIVKVDFGASLNNNTPVATNWGDVGSLDYPTDLHLFQDGPDWYGLTINAETNTITRFYFTNSFSNVPTGTNFGNIGDLNYPTGIYAITKNNNWYAFVSNAGSGFDNSSNASITRLDFGNSLLNTPTAVNLGNPGNTLHSSRDLTIFQSCNEIFGFIVNYSTENDIVRLDFNNSLTAVPTATSLGNIGSLSFPHCISKIFRVGNDLYSFIANASSNTITRLQFQGCSNSSIASSTLQNPPAVIYNSPGTYNINLTIDDGLPTQSSTCKQIEVIQELCDTIKITGPDRICNVNDTVTYSILKSANCTQQFNVEVDNTFATIVSQSANSVKLFYKKNGATKIKVAFQNRCKTVADSLNVAVKFSTQSIDLGNDVKTCNDTSFVLHAGPGFDSYLWQNGSTDSVFSISQAGSYNVVAKNFCGQQFSDAMQFIKPSIIPFSVEPSNAKACIGDSILFKAAGGTSYLWQPTSAFQNSSASLSEALIVGSQNFSLTISDSVCKRDTSFTIAVIASEKPTISISKSNDVNCNKDSALLIASGGDSYQWSPNSDISTNRGNSIMVKPHQSTTYSVYAENTEGCGAKDSVTVYFFKDGKQNLFMPTAFTPNGDGLNDIFRPLFTGPATNYQFKVFNRWGQLVFESKTPGIGWDGKYNGVQQSSGAYVFYIAAQGFCNGTFEQKGTFSLIR